VNDLILLPGIPAESACWKKCRINAKIQKPVSSQKQPTQTHRTMKRLFASAAAVLSAVGIAIAGGPTPSYQWNFNMTNSTPATNYILPTTSVGVGNFPATSQGVLRMLTAAGSATNLLGLPGSGVSGGSEPLSPYDRAITLIGSMGGAGPIATTPDQASTIPAGLITNFTITAWVKPDSAISGFPRIFMLAGQNVDAASGSFNSLGLLFFTGNNLQLKIHNLGGNGVSTSTGPLASAQTNWAFIAITYDSTLDPLVTSNVYFYVGDRVNTLGSPIGLPYALTSVNSVAPANPNGPGYINFAGSDFLNGDGSPGLTNAWVSIGNRPNDRGRSFNGRYDDVRFYANQVLDQSQLEQVRMDAYPFQPLPLQVTTPPQDTTVAEGHGASFTVEHSEAPNTTYQWYRIDPGSGTSNAIAGATGKTYVTPALTIAADNGAKYAVRVTSTDPIAGSVYSSYGTVTVVSAGSYAETPGMLTFEYFSDYGGTSVSGFLGAPPANYPFAPNLTKYLSSFDSRKVFPDDSHNNYFVKISGWLTPDQTTNYVFYVRASDQAELYLSTDDTTNNLALIASDSQDGQQVFFGPESLTPGTTFSSPVALTAGQRYAVVAYLKAGSVEDLVQVAWKTDSGANDLPANDSEIADRLSPIPASALSTIALPNGTISISQNPTGTSVLAHSKVTLNTAASSSGPGPVVLQWRRNGINIPGATGTSYTTPYLTATANYDVVASIPGVSATSTVATVTINADNGAPTVVSATADDTLRAVKVNFSEPVDATTALNPANYSIPGLTVLSAAYSPNTNTVANSAYDTVKLTTSLQADNTAYTVTVTEVKDTANNTISASNSAKFNSFGFVSGFAKSEYFENQTYSSLAGLDVNGFVAQSLKFTNSDPDTAVFRSSAEMSPDGTPTVRSSSGGNIYIYPPSYGTKMSAYFVAPQTTNYVFYIAANDTAILWLSTDSNPSNKHVIAYQDFSGGKRNWNTTATVNNRSATFLTSNVGGIVTVPGATPWPVTDGNGYAVISLVAGQRYYLELDHFENGGYDSYAAVTYVTAVDNASVTPPTGGDAPALTGSVIGWPFPAAAINSFAVTGGNANISWSGGSSSIDSGALGYPGLGSITASEYTTPVLKSATNVTGPYSTLSATSPVSKPATNVTEFFRVAP
jgi:hypothetical protein